jgi:hypothetical protein
MIKAVFSIRAFNSTAWLQSLDVETFKKFYDFMERTKLQDRVITGTKNYIHEFSTAKAHKF